MSKRNNSADFLSILKEHGITKLYHFTDRDNLDSIVANGGLYSWADCEDRSIAIPKPGGSNSSRILDARYGLQHYVRLSFTPKHPMMFVAMNDGRISNPIILEVDLDVILDETTKFPIEMQQRMELILAMILKPLSVSILICSKLILILT